MSDNEEDYYSDSDSVKSDEESYVDKKHVLINPVKKFNNNNNNNNKFDEDEIDDSEPDDNFDENEDEDEDEDDNEENTKIGGGDNDDLEEDEEDNEENEIDDNDKMVKISKPNKTTQLIIEDDEDDDEDEYDENYLQKFDNELNKNYITEFHPECLNHNNDEVAKLSKVVRNENNIIIDPLHKTLPYLTKYEKARILGQRAKQIEIGSKPFVKVPENIIDSYIIAELELREKKIPFIIKRPIPGGAFEYWRVKDLENIDF
jgi:DNA-directed RNA polymerase I, II, and III subunit RPABC2